MRRTLFLLVATGALLLVGSSAYAGDDWHRGRGHHHHHHHHGHYHRSYRPAPWFAPPPRFSVGYGVYPRYGFGYRDRCAPRYGYGGRGLSISFGF